MTESEFPYRLENKLVKSTIKINSELISELKNKRSYLDYYLPDVCYELNMETIFDNNVLCIEYENSSRGMVSHAAKYLSLAKNHPHIYYLVIIVESLNHQKKHKLDKKLATHLMESYTYPNLIFYNFNCDGTAKTLNEMINFSIQEVLNKV